MDAWLELTQYQLNEYYNTYMENDMEKRENDRLHTLVILGLCMLIVLAVVLCIVFVIHTPAVDVPSCTVKFYESGICGY